MSYILDALRRAEAERGANAGAPGNVFAAPVHSAPRPRAGRSRWIAVLGLVAALLAAAALWWWSRPPASTAVEAPRGQPVEPSAPSAIEPPMVAASALTRTEPLAPAPAPERAPVLAPDPTPQEPAPILAPEPPPPARPAPPDLGERAPPPPTGAAPAPAPAPTASNGPASAPPVRVTGATYSDNPAHRMLIANGKVVLEGQEIEPGLVLEVITPHSAVLNHRGARYNINY